MSISQVAINAKKIIEQKGLKQKSVAERMGLSENQMSALLNGRKVIDSEIITSLCAALNSEPNELFEPTDQ
ncbi:MAG: helix-turn-helix transcriptional regulator [Oscillospiraceae bacterium]|nr:helix-turn-helix transcriptional regulator [Oscillospiraceae bacterium]